MATDELSIRREIAETLRLRPRAYQWEVFDQARKSNVRPHHCLTSIHCSPRTIQFWPMNSMMHVGNHAHRVYVTCPCRSLPTLTQVRH